MTSSAEKPSGGGGGDGGSANEGGAPLTAEEFSRVCVQRSVARVCAHLGFTAINQVPLDVMGDLLRRYILKFGLLMSVHKEELCNRWYNEPEDALYALKELGTTLPELWTYMQQVAPTASLTEQVAMFPVPVNSSAAAASQSHLHLPKPTHFYSNEASVPEMGSMGKTIEETIAESFPHEPEQQPQQTTNEEMMEADVKNEPGAAVDSFTEPAVSLTREAAPPPSGAAGTLPTSVTLEYEEDNSNSTTSITPKKVVLLKQSLLKKPMEQEKDPSLVGSGGTSRKLRLGGDEEVNSPKRTSGALSEENTPEKAPSEKPTNDSGMRREIEDLPTSAQAKPDAVKQEPEPAVSLVKKIAIPAPKPPPKPRPPPVESPPIMRPVSLVKMLPNAPTEPKQAEKKKPPNKTDDITEKDPPSEGLFIKKIKTEPHLPELAFKEKSDSVKKSGSLSNLLAGESSAKKKSSDKLQISIGGLTGLTGPKLKTSPKKKHKQKLNIFNDFEEKQSKSIRSDSETGGFSDDDVTVVRKERRDTERKSVVNLESDSEDDRPEESCIASGYSSPEESAAGHTHPPMTPDPGSQTQAGLTTSTPGLDEPPTFAPLSPDDIKEAPPESPDLDGTLKPSEAPEILPPSLVKARFTPARDSSVTPPPKTPLVFDSDCKVSLTRLFSRDRRRRDDSINIPASPVLSPQQEDALQVNLKSAFYESSTSRSPDEDVPKTPDFGDDDELPVSPVLDSEDAPASPQLDSSLPQLVHVTEMTSTKSSDAPDSVDALDEDGDSYQEMPVLTPTPAVPLDPWHAPYFRPGSRSATDEPSSDQETDPESFQGQPKSPCLDVPASPMTTQATRVPSPVLSPVISVPDVPPSPPIPLSPTSSSIGCPKTPPLLDDDPAYPPDPPPLSPHFQSPSRIESEVPPRTPMLDTSSFQPPKSPELDDDAAAGFDDIFPPVLSFGPSESQAAAEERRAHKKAKKRKHSPERKHKHKKHKKNTDEAIFIPKITLKLAGENFVIKKEPSPPVSGNAPAVPSPKPPSPPPPVPPAAVGGSQGRATPVPKPVPRQVAVKLEVEPEVHTPPEEGNQLWICPSCKLPDNGSPMIGCDSCDQWYHWLCLGISEEPAEENWFCPLCKPKTTTAPPSSGKKRGGKKGGGAGGGKKR